MTRPRSCSTTGRYQPSPQVSVSENGTGRHTPCLASSSANATIAITVSLIMRDGRQSHKSPISPLHPLPFLTRLLCYRSILRCFCQQCSSHTRLTNLETRHNHCFFIGSLYDEQLTGSTRSREDSSFRNCEGTQICLVQSTIMKMKSLSKKKREKCIWFMSLLSYS